MRQKIRKTIVAISLLLFPITLNYFSPYVSIDGAMKGIVSGSVLLFAFLFLNGIFFGRAWCGWVCPVAGLSEVGMTINNRVVNRKKLRIIRYAIFIIWTSILITMLLLAGGIKSINPLHLTENVISVDSPIKFITYYFVLALLFFATILVGRRGACQSLCWMAPFLTAGYQVGRFLKVPQLRVYADQNSCVNCGACDKICPMSIPVATDLKVGRIYTSDCILCGECADGCKKNVLSVKIKSFTH
jgi:ferredoxin-type protein NapH